MNLFEKAKIKDDDSYLCLNCGEKFNPDKRNLKRGWGLFCSKRCSSEYTNKLKSMTNFCFHFKHYNKFLV